MHAIPLGMLAAWTYSIWTRCVASWPTTTASPRCPSRSWRSTRRSVRRATQPGGDGAPGRDDGGRKRGLRDQIGAAFAAEVERLAALAADALGCGAGVAPVELTIRTAMIQLGAELLQQLVAADTGHLRAADRLLQGASRRVRRLPRQAGRHRAGPDHRAPRLVSLRRMRTRDRAARRRSRCRGRVAVAGPALDDRPRRGRAAVRRRRRAARRTSRNTVVGEADRTLRRN